jgi:hypothetical protein
VRLSGGGGAGGGTRTSKSSSIRLASSSDTIPLLSSTGCKHHRKARTIKLAHQHCSSSTWCREVVYAQSSGMGEGTWQHCAYVTMAYDVTNARREAEKL